MESASGVRAATRVRARVKKFLITRRTRAGDQAIRRRDVASPSRVFFATIGAARRGATRRSSWLDRSAAAAAAATATATPILRL